MTALARFGASVRLLLLVLATTTLAVAGGGIAVAQECSTRSKELTDASRAGRLEEAAQLFRELEKSGACSGAILVPLAHNVAVAYGHAAFTGEKSAEERAKVLKVGLLFSRPWRLVAGLADLETANQRFVEAATLYQEALDIISDDTCTSSEQKLRPVCREITPPAVEIRAIHSRAIAARLLADRYVAAPVTRHGEPGGLARPSFRSFTPRAVAIPVHFELGRTEFTPEGRKAVADMLGYLTREGFPSIELIGHADERGTESFNQVLSLQRAEAVKRFLIEGGYKGSINASGRGKSQPFQADDPGSYTQEQRWQLDRRVELSRKQVP